MDTILLRVSDLKLLTDELIKDNRQYVEIQLDEADDDLPACVSPTAYSSDDPICHDYEVIEAVSPDEFAPSSTIHTNV